jgi:hypothetical protein
MNVFSTPSLLPALMQQITGIIGIYSRASLACACSIEKQENSENPLHLLVGIT